MYCRPGKCGRQADLHCKYDQDRCLADTVSGAGKLIGTVSEIRVSVLPAR